jgi:triosephosphate isomerase (TIM)
MKLSARLFLLSVSSAATAFVSQKSGPPRFGTFTINDGSSTQLFDRKPFITGNWKLNPQTKAEAVDLARAIAASIPDDSPCDVGLFVPFPFLESVQNVVGDKLIVGAEVSDVCGVEGSLVGGHPVV